MVLHEPDRAAKHVLTPRKRTVGAGRLRVSGGRGGSTHQGASDGSKSFLTGLTVIQVAGGVPSPDQSGLGTVKVGTPLRQSAVPSARDSLPWRSSSIKHGPRTGGGLGKMPGDGIAGHGVATTSAEGSLGSRRSAIQRHNSNVATLGAARDADARQAHLRGGTLAWQFGPNLVESRRVRTVVDGRSEGTVISRLRGYVGATQAPAHLLSTQDAQTGTNVEVVIANWTEHLELGLGRGAGRNGRLDSTTQDGSALIPRAPESISRARGGKSRPAPYADRRADVVATRAERPRGHNLRNGKRHDTPRGRNPEQQADTRTLVVVIGRPAHRFLGTASSLAKDGSSD